MSFALGGADLTVEGFWEHGLQKRGPDQFFLRSGPCNKCSQNLKRSRREARVFFTRKGKQVTQIGTIEEVLNGGETEYWGQIRTLDYSLDFVMRTNEDIRNPTSPSYLVFAKAKTGSDVHVGNCWTRQPKSNGLSGREFFSLTFDDPSFERPLNVAAFTDDGKRWRISWRRRIASAKPAEAE